jgi:hypothetical protein
MGEIGGENSQGEDARHETAQRRQRGMRAAIVIGGEQHAEEKLVEAADEREVEGEVEIRVAAVTGE